MKRGLLCILFVVLLTVNVLVAVASESTPVVLINEDFSKFVEGSETAPAEQDLADESTGAIDAQYTQQAGWSGMGIFQAGGICAIAPVYNYYFYEGGYLNTPKGDYSGVITYSFRARLQEGEQSKINVVKVITLSILMHIHLPLTGKPIRESLKKVLLTVVLFSFLLAMKTKF